LRLYVIIYNILKDVTVYHNLFIVNKYAVRESYDAILFYKHWTQRFCNELEGAAGHYDQY